MYYKTMQMQAPLTYEQADFVLQLRMLMSKLAYLSRFYIIERITGIGSAQEIIDEMLTIPAEINELAANIGFNADFRPVTLSYTSALRELVDAMIDGDQARADEAIQNLYNVSNENAAYLAGINPNWDEVKWRGIFYRFAQDVIAEVIAIQARDFNTALDVFESLVVNTLQRGDYYAEGLIPFMPQEGALIPPAYFNMINSFRKLLAEWAYLLRFYIASRVTGLGNTGYVAQRMYALPSRLKEKFEILFGDETSNKLLNEFLIFIVRLQEMIEAVVKENQEEIEARVLDAYLYADELAAYLSSINPYWDEEEGRRFFYSLIELILEESYVLQSGDEVGDMRVFERLMSTALNMGDFFAEGAYLYTLINSENVAEQQQIKQH